MDNSLLTLERHARATDLPKDKVLWLVGRVRALDPSLDDDVFFDLIRELGGEARALYARWLEQRTQLDRAEYTRAEIELFEAETPARRAAFLSARAKVDATWLDRMEQPSLLRSCPFGGEAAWWSVNLGPYRPGANTYARYPHRTLPDLETDLEQVVRRERAPRGSTLAEAILRRGFEPDPLMILLDDKHPGTFFFTQDPHLRPLADGLLAEFQTYDDVTWAIWHHSSGTCMVVAKTRGGEYEFVAPSLGSFLTRIGVEHGIFWSLNPCAGKLPGELDAEELKYAEHFQQFSREELLVAHIVAAEEGAFRRQFPELEPVFNDDTIDELCWTYASVLEEGGRPAPASPPEHIAFARALYGSGSFESAAEQYRLAFLADPRLSEYPMHLELLFAAFSAARTGEVELALAWVREFVTRDLRFVAVLDERLASDPSALVQADLSQLRETCLRQIELLAAEEHLEALHAHPEFLAAITLPSA